MLENNLLMPEVMVIAGKPSSKSLGKRPARNSVVPSSKHALSDYTLSRESSGLNGDAEDCSAPPSVDGSGRSRVKNQKRVLPPRVRRGGPEAAVGVGEVDLSILDLLRRRGESDPLIPRKTVFVLTTDSRYISTASTSEIGLNRCANERFFEQPEVIRAFKEQQDIQIPEFTQIPDHDMVSSKLRVRSGGMVEMDFSDAAYEKRHRRHELAEKRQRLREKEQLEYEHYRLKQRIDQLRTMDSNIFLTLSDEIFGMANTFTEENVDFSAFPSAENNGSFSEGEKRRQTMLRAAEILELRYRTLLLDKRLPKKDKVTETASAPPEREASPEGLGNQDGIIVEPEADNSILITTTTSNAKPPKRKPNKRENNRTAPLPSASPYSIDHSEQETLEQHPEANSHTIITSHQPPPSRNSLQLNGTGDARMELLQDRSRETQAIQGNGDNPPPYDDNAAATGLALLNQAGTVTVSSKLSQNDVKKSQRKKQKLELNNVQFIGEQGHIRIDDIPEFSPTSAFPAHEFFPEPKDVSITPREQTEESTSPASLVAQMENVTISAQEDSVSRPQRRRGRPPKVKQTDQVAEKSADKPAQKVNVSESITASSSVIDEMARTPLSVYEPITGPGRRPFVPCIVAASRHNTDYGRKSGRSVKAFGAEVPAFDERDVDYELPLDIIEQVEDARDGPGARGDPIPANMLHSKHIWSHEPSVSTRG